MQAMVMPQGDEKYPQAQKHMSKKGDDVTRDSTGDVELPQDEASNKPRCMSGKREEQGCGGLGGSSKT